MQYTADKFEVNDLLKEDKEEEIKNKIESDKKTNNVKILENGEICIPYSACFVVKTIHDFD